jgi:hypothetical protein
VTPPCYLEVPTQEKEMKEKEMKAIFIIAGAAIGLLVVRVFMLDAIEEIAWRIFWHELFNGNITVGMGEVFKSATFIKSLTGIVVGAALGARAGSKYSAQ